uniref:Uncharacterized protein n=1 Tax=Anguilla anguilla TaxID=7936 RepID=A0A0E9PAS9_ANGAN
MTNQSEWQNYAAFQKQSEPHPI